ncbi:hypothetical protein KA017_00885 [Candidatus Woesebacteria bacterium]|nr:hypothetical protein [Candidatus Woesebacteria bacterium]
MAIVEQRTTLSEVWNAVDLLQRHEPPKILTALLLAFKEKKLIDEETQLFLFDSLPLYYLLKKESYNQNHFGDTLMVPLLVQAGLASHFFNTPENLPAEQQRRIDQIASYFTVGPNDIDLKIPGLDNTHWQATMEWLTKNSQSVRKTNDKEEYFCIETHIWEDAMPVRFTDIEIYKHLPISKRKNREINAIRATVLENIDGHHNAGESEKNKLTVIIIELGFCSQDNQSLDTFQPTATIHISNIPDHDTRLQKVPNSSLAQITPTLQIPKNVNQEIVIEYPENFENLLFDELKLLLDPSKPLESFVAAISFFRKITVKHRFANEYLKNKLCSPDTSPDMKTKMIENPFILFYTLFNEYLNSLPEPIKLTQEYDITRFSSDLALIAIAVGPKEFSKILVSTGLVNYIGENVAEIAKQEITTRPFCKGLLKERTTAKIQKTNTSIEVSFTPSPYPENFEQNESYPLPWDGLTALIQLLREKTEIELSQYPLLCFINLFCAPFFTENQK